MMGMRREGGQAAIETAVYMAMAVIALVTLVVYVQRAYQGYLYTNASAHGPQFDPNQQYAIRQNLNNFTQRIQSDITVTTPAMKDPDGDPVNGLPSIKGGQVPGRLITSVTKTNTNWAVSRNGSQDAQ